MPQNACEGYIEMPSNIFIFGSFPISISITCFFFSEYPTFLCSKLLKCPIFRIFLGHFKKPPIRSFVPRVPLSSIKYLENVSLKSRRKTWFKLLYMQVFYTEVSRSEIWDWDIETIVVFRLFSRNHFKLLHPRRSIDYCELNLNFQVLISKFFSHIGYS